mgnify:CR=1 FL=1
MQWAVAPGDKARLSSGERGAASGWIRPKHPGAETFGALETAGMSMRNYSVFLCLMGIVACGGSNDGSGIGEQNEVLQGSRGDVSVREACVGRGEELATDVNNDGVPDIRHVMSNGTRICTEIDMNFDGRTDVTRFYDADGQTPIREEHDFDFDGRMDQIAYFEAGDLSRKELDTNFNSRIDTWMWCEEGRVSRAERDRTNDGDVDTWEVYERGYLTEARYDDNNDGQPEKWEVFRNGRLTEVRYDTDRDGQPDRAEEIPADQAGQAEDRLGCSVLPDEEPEEAAPPPPPAGEPQNGTVPAEGTEGTTEGDDAPWAGASDVTEEEEGSE